MDNHTPHFPKTYANLATYELLSVFDAGPERYPQVLEGLKEQDLKAHPKAGKWSIQEIVMHVADSEIMGAARIRQTFAQPGSTYAIYDQDVWARVCAYQDQDNAALQSALKLFEALRRTSSGIFHQAKQDDWQKAGYHAEFGHLTLRQLLELYADHSERHIQQILDLRSLMAKSLNFPLLLEERLY